MTAIHVADTGLFVAMGRPSNRRYRAVRTFARRNDVTFVLPERVYDELTVNASESEQPSVDTPPVDTPPVDTPPVDTPPVDTPPVDTAIEEAWARVAPTLTYSNALVSRTMDGVQRYIANADDRLADEIERADPALAGVAAQAFAEGRADRAYIYTTDTLAGEGVETVLGNEGYGDSITYVSGFRFVEELLE